MKYRTVGASSPSQIWMRCSVCLFLIKMKILLTLAHWGKCWSQSDDNWGGINRPTPLKEECLNTKKALYWQLSTHSAMSGSHYICLSWLRSCMDRLLAAKHVRLERCVGKHSRLFPKPQPRELSRSNDIIFNSWQYFRLLSTLLKK